MDVDKRTCGSEDRNTKGGSNVMEERRDGNAKRDGGREGIRTITDKGREEREQGT